MSITQTVEIPASRRLTVDVPLEVPTGPVIISFRPAAAPSARPRMTETEEAEYFRLHADELNAEAEDVLSYQKPILEDDR